MKYTTLFLLLTVLLAGCSTKPSNLETVKQVSIVPEPQQIVYEDSAFTLDKSTSIFYTDHDSLNKNTAYQLQDYIFQVMGIQLNVTIGTESSLGIVLCSGGTGNPESYTLTIHKNQIKIKGVSAQGTFWGVQSLRQIIPPLVTKEKLSLPGVEIKDEPRFAYRGAMLDVCRHFFSVDEVKTYIDLLAMHKMNYFHWHLTDDQGWRIEIKKYPKLTQIGAYRDQTLIGRKGKSDTYDGKRYGGFYTQAQVEDIVKYASERFITIVPEIDLPGHMVAALTSYPQLGCTGGPYEVRTTWGIADEVLCAGNDQAINFVNDVMDEVIDLFPGKYIHLGGDECPKTSWKKCPKCQARIKKEHLKDEHELQSYFIEKVAKHIQSKGRTVIGWEEILEGYPLENTVIMSWRGKKAELEAIKEHHYVIMAPKTNCYFDYYQTTDVDSVPLAIGGYVSLAKVYDFNPIPAELQPEDQKYILGGQANIWTEYMSDFRNNVEYMLLPRLAALSESVWTSPARKNWADFKLRLSSLTHYYEAMHVNYDSKHFDEPLEKKKSNE